MADARTVDDLKEAGANSPAPDAVVALYLQAFEEFGARALEQPAGPQSDRRRCARDLV